MNDEDITLTYYFMNPKELKVSDDKLVKSIIHHIKLLNINFFIDSFIFDVFIGWCKLNKWILENDEIISCVISNKPKFLDKERGLLILKNIKEYHSIIIDMIKKRTSSLNDSFISLNI